MLIKAFYYYWYLISNQCKLNFPSKQYKYVYHGVCIAAQTLVMLLVILNSHIITSFNLAGKAYYGFYQQDLCLVSSVRVRVRFCEVGLLCCGTVLVEHSQPEVRLTPSLLKLTRLKS